MTDDETPAAAGEDAAPTPDSVGARILAFAAANGLDAEPGGRPGEFVVVLPGEKKLRTVVSLLVGERELSASAFVVRNPDECHEDVYRFLLRRNLRMRAGNLAYAIDDSGDVYVVGSLPLAAVDEDALDRLFGAVLESADAPFNELLVLGFLTSMKREWAWRVSRGESLRNLEAFRHLLEGSELEPPPDQRPESPTPQRHASGGERPEGS